MDKAGIPAPKKPYTPPVLTVYGTVRDLTNQVGAHGQNDGGSAITGKFKTTV
ncbi:MAG TPA: lasso RiPP family leader peptide-containing protein [Candidatus Dormibacteraeota bacterium]|nr:lasso RiPP family leader peptide-containing protein [Candidatus Dormibacteraeota bacterium]